MVFVPVWAKPAAILGLKMQIAQLEVLMEYAADTQHRAKIDEFLAEIDRIEAMKS